MIGGLGPPTNRLIVANTQRAILRREQIGGSSLMNATRPFAIVAWIALPAVMYGGYALLSLLTHNGLDEFRQTFFRAGHAHAGVLLLLALLYHSYLSRTTISNPLKLGASSVLLLGILAQSGGFFLHMAIGEPGCHRSAPLLRPSERDYSLLQS